MFSSFKSIIKRPISPSWMSLALPSLHQSVGCCSEKIWSYTLRGLIEKINGEDIWVGVGAELFRLSEVNIISPKKSGNGPAGMMIIYVFSNGKVFHRLNYSYLLNMELEDSQGEWSACSRSFLPSIYKGLING